MSDAVQFCTLLELCCFIFFPSIVCLELKYFHVNVLAFSGEHAYISKVNVVTFHLQQAPSIN